MDKEEKFLLMDKSMKDHFFKEKNKDKEERNFLMEIYILGNLKTIL